MKKINFILVATVFFMCSLVVNAQDKDYFAGNWELVVHSTPEGDGIMLVNLERDADGKFTGTISDKSKGTKLKITKVDEKANNITLYFESESGYDVYVFIEKGKDDKVTGSVMDMFYISGKRVEDKDKK